MTHVVYFAQRADGDIKIGTTSNFEKRMRTLVFTSNSSLHVLGIIPGGRDREKDMHARFAAYRRMKGGNPRRAYTTEWFAPAPELLWFITFETQPPPATHFRLGGPKERVCVADAPRLWYKRPDGGSSCAPTTNEVQRRLFQRFGSLDVINYAHLAKETGIAYMAIAYWLEGWITDCEMVTVRKWAAYLNCTPDDLLAHAGKGAPPNTPAPAKRHERGWRTPKEQTA